VAQAWHNGHPSVTQGSRERRIEQVLCLQQTWEKGRVGWGKIGSVAKIVELKIEDLTGEVRRRGRLRSKILNESQATSASALWDQSGPTFCYFRPFYLI
jgi:hypothetical protein